MHQVLSVFLILWLKLLRWTCRVRAINDPRPAIRDEGKTYLFASLHAHQLASITRAEPGTGALVSRSRDGELIARLLKTCSVTPIRGSSGERRKGGAAALRALVNHVQGGNPAFLAVDGPKGPRGTVHPGIALLSQKTGAPVLPLSFVPSRRIVIARAWDRLQIPLPFCSIKAYFGEPLTMNPGESVKAFTARIEAALNELERDTDPVEAIHSRGVLSQEAPSRRAA